METALIGKFYGILLVTTQIDNFMVKHKNKNL